MYKLPFYDQEFGENNAQHKSTDQGIGNNDTRHHPPRTAPPPSLLLSEVYNFWKIEYGIYI